VESVAIYFKSLFGAAQSGEVANLIYAIQAFLTLLAVFATIYIATSESRRRTRARFAFRMGINLIATRTKYLTDTILDGQLYRGGAAVAEFGRETEFYTAVIKRRVLEIQNLLMSASIDQLAEAGLLEAVLNLRQGMNELAGDIDQYRFDLGRPEGASLVRFQQVINYVDRALWILGIGDRQVDDELKKKYRLRKRDSSKRNYT